MTDFNAIMHQITGLQPPADPLAGFHGPTSKGRRGREGVGKEREGMSGFFPEPTCQVP